MNDLYTLADFKVGDRVRAFHPLAFGVVYTATVATVGRKYLTVRFGVDAPAHRRSNADARTRRITPRDVTGFA